MMNFWKSCLDVKWLWGSDFFNFSLPKTSPHMGHVTGVKFFFISQGWICDISGGDHQLKLPQNDDFSKSSSDTKLLWGSDFFDFLLPKTYPHMGCDFEMPRALAIASLPSPLLQCWSIICMGRYDVITIWAKIVKNSPLNAFATLCEQNFEIQQGSGRMSSTLKECPQQGKSKAKVEHYSCCRESHMNGNPHYHVALKLRMSSTLTECP